MLRTLRRLNVAELDASYDLFDLRMPWMRVSVARGRNVTSDFALVDKAAPFIRRLATPRSAVTIVLRGRSRFDEDGRRGWIETGSFVASELARAGSEAHSGVESDVLVVEWDPRVLGASFPSPFAVERLGVADLARLDELARALRGPHAAAAVVDVFAILHAVGFPVMPPTIADLADDRQPSMQRAARVQEASSELLSALHRHPDVEDVVAAVHGNARQVHRDIDALARRFALPWTNWRTALHHTRICNALRLLSAPGATTELVARATGFRGPSALCHALAKGGLPSPGVLARAARRDVLETWTSYAVRASAVNAA